MVINGTCGAGWTRHSPSGDATPDGVVVGGCQGLGGGSSCGSATPSSCVGGSCSSLLSGTQLLGCLVSDGLVTHSVQKNNMQLCKLVCSNFSIS